MTGQLEPAIIRLSRDHRYERPEQGRACVQCGRAKAHALHAGAPPSLNVHGSGANRFVYQKLKKDWEERITDALRGTDLPAGLGGVVVEGRMCFPDRIRRDQGNFRHLVEKALGDALVRGGWLEDDDWSRYEFAGLAHLYVKGESWTELAIFPRWPEQGESGLLQERLEL